MLDPFKGYANNPYPVFDNVLETAPSDSQDLPIVASCLYVEPVTNGIPVEVKVTTAGGQDFTFRTPGGEFPLLRVRKVWATGTTAAAVWAFW